MVRLIFCIHTTYTFQTIHITHILSNGGMLVLYPLVLLTHSSLNLASPVKKMPAIYQPFQSLHVINSAYS